MDFISDILKAKGGDLVAAVLEKSDLGQAEAEAFVPEAGKSVAATLMKSAGDLDLSNLAAAANVTSLLGKIDAGGLARSAGLTPERGTSALSAMLPLVLRFVGENGNAMKLLSGLGKADGVMDGLKGLGGKLFG